MSVYNLTKFYLKTTNTNRMVLAEITTHVAQQNNTTNINVMVRLVFQIAKKSVNLVFRGLGS